MPDALPIQLLLSSLLSKFYLPGQRGVLLRYFVRPHSQQGFRSGARGRPVRGSPREGYFPKGSPAVSPIAWAHTQLLCGPKELSLSILTFPRGELFLAGERSLEPSLTLLSLKDPQPWAICLLVHDYLL